MEIYHIKDLSFAFPEQEKKALDTLNLSINSGEFVTVVGRSGCGKSTLLRHLKSVLTPHGERSGAILYKGQPLNAADLRTQAADIGFVLQNPDNQIVTDKVWHELAFGLESLGLDQQTMRLRVAEMASFFGIQTWFHRNVAELSGGQKQLLNLASIMAMHPSVLILDEPTSQLDPIAAMEFLDTVQRINRELGTTVIMCEHRLEEVLPISDRLIVMDRGAIIADHTPRAAGEALRAAGHPMFASMPAPMRIHAAVTRQGTMDSQRPLTIKEGRQWLQDNMLQEAAEPMEQIVSTGKTANPNPVVVQFKDVWCKYEKHGADIIKDLSFEVRRGQFYCIVGGNGTGKSTTLSLLSGILKPNRGKVLVEGQQPSAMKVRDLFHNRLGVLPQNPQSLFVKKTVELDLYEVLSDVKLSSEEKKAKVDQVVAFAELESLLAMHPYDLSGGEQQRAALAKVLLLNPTILLLDEPTKGLDAFFKEKLGAFLHKLRSDGVTIIMVSHDIEFCAKYGEVCSMFFDGSMIASNETNTFFAGNHFYTTAANRMARHLWRDAVTTESVITRCLNSR
ncbi:energy-coupling factor transport system ATP-binding protein [Paenibacillus cellulosilyticus]|uniref:Energy-coupling factor transport system ATP-binding protein n=1 Tax=Paenibacillus cellulosilyticus TaxID=375489 RepID=A0A2V2YUV7_9BACL|nr:ATP-binding cassette domain-containing protein [Paenibacillus cellulosilyticus]PWW04757.1 energy-coupling factor transport system ATP-binding protein [Paenibacillus cellulosilyticus]QKS45881.1 ATP-binding cassette domain-containing protein [Paenibacillus cellulosilyticus]